MKIAEIITLPENLNAGAGGVTVGNAGGESIMMRPPAAPARKMKQIPQVGYGIKIGNMAIPTPQYPPENDLGQTNSVSGG